MKKIILLLFLLCSSVQAFEIVYPKTQNVIINSDKTFFIGNGKLSINNIEVKTHFSGGFKYPVKLDFGVNKFYLKNGNQTQIYTITRQKLSDISQEKQIDYFVQPFSVITRTDNVPLRSTPVDAGLNRLQHLPKDIELLATGQYSDFYRVQLARDDYAWISKSNVLKLNNDIQKGYLISQNYQDTETTEIYTFNLSKKLPYVLSEDKQGFYLVIYDIESTLGKYETPIPHEGKNFGYKSYYTPNNDLIVEINKYYTGLEGVTITIDAGHGGNEYGAVGCLGDKEKDINLQIAKKLRDKLIEAGAIVYMTRDTDKFVGLQERVDFANKNDSQIFISIHNNAIPDSQADREVTGTEVYYFYPQSKELARFVGENLTKETGFRNNGIKGGSFAVIRNTNAVSILVEAGYMIEPEDNYKLRQDEFQDKIAEGILKGLKSYLK